MINWAHTCEMPDPWHWLEPFDMLMTNGIGLPADPEEQARYLSRLADAGISAIAIGEDVGAPSISSAMVSASERRALPILLTAFEVPFAAVARVVADSRIDIEESRRLTKTARIYELLRTATIEGRGAAHLLNELGAELGCHLKVLDLASWREAFAPSRRAPVAVRDVLHDALARCAGHLPAILRLDLDGGAGSPSRSPPVVRRCSPAASRIGAGAERASARVDGRGVELEKLASERTRWRRRRGAARRPAGRGARPGERCQAARRSEPQPRSAGRGGVARRGGRAARCRSGTVAREVPHLLRAGGHDSITLALLPDSDGARAMLLEALPEGCCIGLSAEVLEPDRVSAAAREARWALHGCAPTRSCVVRYGTGGTLPWGLTLEGAEEVAGHVLGSLVEYDHFDDRAAADACRAAPQRPLTDQDPAELFIHRQTLSTACDGSSADRAKPVAH